MAELIAAWLPIVVIAVVFGLVMRYSAKSYARHVDRVQAINDETLAINREMIAELREIKELLKDRK
jgi:hypothetical protein